MNNVIYKALDFWFVSLAWNRSRYGEQTLTVEKAIRTLRRVAEAEKTESVLCRRANRLLGDIVIRQSPRDIEKTIDGT